MPQNIEASFSVLVMSIASSAAMCMGLAPDPASNKLEQDPAMAKFNIDLLLLLKEKTKGNLSSEENSLLDSLIKDLQIKFVEKK